MDDATSVQLSEMRCEGTYGMYRPATGFDVRQIGTVAWDKVPKIVDTEARAAGSYGTEHDGSRWLIWGIGAMLAGELSLNRPIFGQGLATFYT